VQILIHTRQRICWLVFAAFFGAGLGVAHAQTLVAPEYKIKSAFLYNFVKLTEWPTNAFVSSNAPISIGIIGKDPFGDVLEDTVKDKVINCRKILIQRFEELDKGFEKCHLLFIATTEEERLEKILALVAKQTVLTVSEIERFDYRGGMIWLIKEGDEIKFSIKQAAVQEAGLKLSSKVLALSVNAQTTSKENK
jgi:hypothetical protein